MYSFVKIAPNGRTVKWPNPTPGDHYLNKLEFTLHEDASTQITEFWSIGF